MAYDNEFRGIWFKWVQVELLEMNVHTHTLSIEKQNKHGGARIPGAIYAGNILEKKKAIYSKRTKSLQKKRHGLS